MFYKILLAFALLLLSSMGWAIEVVSVGGTQCEHGLRQHHKGTFAVYVFCDGAIGTQLGVILTKPGLGPIAENTPWNFGNRFWQEGNWFTNVKQYIWSESGNYLYVSTSEVYSDESIYEVDLKNQTATKLLDGQKIGRAVNIDKCSDNRIWSGSWSYVIRD